MEDYLTLTAMQRSVKSDTSWERAESWTLVSGLIVRNPDGAFPIIDDDSHTDAGF